MAKYKSLLDRWKTDKNEIKVEPKKGKEKQDEKKKPKMI